MGRKAKAKQDKLSRDMFSATDQQLVDYREEQVAQRKVLKEQRDRYTDFQFKNPYKDMENVMEDMTIDMMTADFQRQQGEQQRANILQALRGSAGTSGIAGLAQSLANQGQLQTQQIAAGISQQERQNQMAERQMAGQLQQMDRQGQMMVDQAEFGRESTLLGMEFGAMTGANAATQQAYANQMSAFGTQAEMLNARIAATGAMIGAGVSALTGGFGAGGTFAPE